jgi:predicted transcriptional regulator
MTVWITIVMIEASSQVTLTVPIVLSVMAAKYVADGIYPTAFAERLIEAKHVKFLPNIDDRLVAGILDSSNVESIMTPHVVGFYQFESVETVKAVMERVAFTRFPVLGSDGVAIGLATREGLEKAIAEAKPNDPDDPVVEIEIPMQTSPLTIHSDFNLRKAYFVFTQMGLRLLMVTDRYNRIQGVVTRDNFIEFIERRRHSKY